MNEAEAIAWFESLLQRGKGIPSLGIYSLEPLQASAWLSEAQTALEATFPPGHAIRRRWLSAAEGTGGKEVQSYHKSNFAGASGVIQSGLTLLKDGRLRGIVDGVKAETVGEILDQAEILVGKDHTVAAAVLAGGALETHLLHLCQQTGLTWAGDGSISKYDQAIAQARNAGTVEVYSATDCKLVKGWGGIRNDAAHKPTKFTHPAVEVRLMVEGIRQFLARVP